MGSQAPGLQDLPPDKVVRLDNAICPYCGALRPEGDNADEHVIGRRFVPKGKFERSWNLILWACTPCNRRKADLEDDISAITMQPGPFGERTSNDPEVAAESVRKGHGSISRITRKPVAMSSDRTELAFDVMPGLSARVMLAGPPLLDRQRIFDLACLQLAGFFYYITYDADLRSGKRWPGAISLAASSPRSDWGNVTFRFFMQTVAGWEMRVLGSAADEYFKISIRRHPGAVCWSWALEWNRNFRLVGFFGEEEPIASLARNFPAVEYLPPVPSADGAVYRVRRDQPLPSDEDNLFADGPRP